MVERWDPDDEWGVAVVATVGRQLKLRREAVGMRAGEFGQAVGLRSGPCPVIHFKYRDAGPRLALPAEAWAGFVAYTAGS